MSPYSCKMKLFVKVKLSLVAVVLAFSTTASAQTNVGCVTMTNPHASTYRTGYGGMVSRTDQSSAANRVSLGLPNLPDAQVTIVTDTVTCRIASAAYDSAVSFSAPTEAPLVLKIGTTNYAVVKGLGNSGGRINVLFNQTFTVPGKKIWY